MSDVRNHIAPRPSGGGTGARKKSPRRIELSVGAGGKGAEFDPIGHPLDPGDDTISNYTINFGPQDRKSVV